MLNENNIIKQNEDSIWCDLDGSAVLLSIENGSYYEMNHIGTKIWLKIAEEIKIGQLVDEFTVKYKLDRTECKTQVLAFVDDMKKENIIDVIKS